MHMVFVLSFGFRLQGVLSCHYVFFTRSYCYVVARYVIDPDQTCIIYENIMKYRVTLPLVTSIHKSIGGYISLYA